MERVLIEREIARILVKMGVREERLVQTARLLQDLRVEGDDAREFFEAISTRFGTDLTALREDWSTHFGSEGLSIAPVGRVVAGAVGVGVAAVLFDLPIPLCVMLSAAGGAGAWLLGRPGGATEARPVRLSEVADAVERGCWERLSGKDR